ncbi:amino acid adenylation domain-containing protein [Streptomyces sp. SID1328]|uniref:amino acid adenylation domain-containing protein n=1 Tax=Streptomyces sp. SID1328 TaxID=2690250 RepID=UPI0013721567|nr:amino acid adenylation domain-containing protein [Streptomyces sp. SID1328]
MPPSRDHDPAEAPRTLPALFARTVARHPDRRAVSDGDTVLTYRELDRRADAVAALLTGCGIGPGDRVGLYTSRSVDVFTALLGVLKVGAAYVAVDDRYPDSRRDLMLTVSGAAAVLTRADWAPRLAGLAVPVVPLPAEYGTAPASALRPDPEDAASVLFTSGSTGTPKAIVLEHRNLVAFALNRALAPLTEEDRVGQISSLSFDLFHYEMWNTFAAGAEVVVLPPVPELLEAGFGAELTRLRVTAMLVPTMVFNHVATEHPDAFAPLRLLQVAGDVILPAACRNILGGGFTGTLHNLYGPAESTTACTAHRVTARDAEGDAIPIGRPLDGVTAHVFTDGRAAAPGETGELLIGGAQLARGYLDAPELTAERFVDDPYGTGIGRVYRTGDLVRLRADGVLDYVGRVDNQCKIRGFRVELGEVERLMRTLPGVRDAVVVPEGEGTDRMLVAFVAGAGPLDEAGVREAAEKELPFFMVPGSLVILPEIPANHHGKRDVAALLGLLAERRRAHADERRALSPTERYLTGLWEELLAETGIGSTDHFFERGGNSLLAFRMRMRIARDLGAGISHRAVLDHPVLADLARAVDSAHAPAPQR